ncbi:hypothetical protein PV327_005993 [Microctonus hyperodae]|uniref:Uncharacterized protein n=1 Tax=Microctonus hyperodae TaxID=165561 RepID=A0AA39L0E9_MICHY|nr:hypothetical protein PV327_005993 [Microctonus hyperodae]
MFVKITTSSSMWKINCGPFFGYFQPDPNVEQSHVGNFFRAKGEFFDKVTNEIKKVMHSGTDVVSNNWNELNKAVSTTIDAYGRLIDSGIAAGVQYGQTIFLANTIVPRTLLDLVINLARDKFISGKKAQDLSYVEGKPKYLFQFVDEAGNVIPVTAEIAHKLVPGLSV